MAVARIKDLFASTMLTGIYSLVSACFFVVMDAVDVAFTEAAVGAGIATLLMLAALSLAGRYEKPVSHDRLLALLTVIATGALLTYGTLDMPAVGAGSPAEHPNAGPDYLARSAAEIGVPNVVTAVLASYRGYDTLGETVVIFTAGIGVLALLGLRRDGAHNVTHAPMHQHRILRVVGKMLIPPIMLFALYVQFHGDYGPGGGFQAGVIFASAFILHAMLFGLDATLAVVNLAWLRLLAAFGVLLYGSVGVVSILSGGSFLDYGVLVDDAVAGQHLGILLVELGVGVTVAAVMVLLFFTFTARADRVEGVDE